MRLTQRTEEREECIYECESAFLRNGTSLSRVEGVEDPLEEEGTGVIEDNTDIGEDEVQDEGLRIRLPKPFQQLSGRARELDMQRACLHRRAELPDIFLIQRIVRSLLEQRDDPTEGCPSPDGCVILRRDGFAL